VSINLIARIIGLLIVVVVLALAPSIVTANAAVQSNANATDLLGMSVVDDFGGMLIILGLLTIGGIFAAGGQMAGTVKDLLSNVGMAIIAIVALTFMSTIIDYNYALYNAASGVEATMYSIISLLIYVAIIGSVASRGYQAGRSYYKSRKGRKTTTAPNF